MEIFPTQYSTLSSAALKDRIEERYGLTHMSCRYLLRGVSDTYVLEGEAGKYIFKVYRDAHRSLEEIKGEAELLTILKEKGAKVSYPIRDLEGGFTQMFTAAEGIRHGVLFSFAKGKSSRLLSDEQLRIIGREMAFNHHITSGIELCHQRKAYTIDTTLTGPLQTLAPAFREFRDEYALLGQTAGMVQYMMEMTDTSSFGYGYCHYDYFPKNFFFDEDNTLTLFDFDFAGKGLLMYDLASFHVHLFMEAFNKRRTMEDVDRALSVVIAGYRELRPLPEKEEAIIPLLGFMLQLFYFGFQYENFDDFSNVYFGPEHVQRFATIMIQYAEQYCTP